MSSSTFHAALKWRSRQYEHKSLPHLLAWCMPTCMCLMKWCCVSCMRISRVLTILIWPSCQKMMAGRWCKARRLPACRGHRVAAKTRFAADRCLQSRLYVQQLPQNLYPGLLMLPFWRGSCFTMLLSSTPRSRRACVVALMLASSVKSLPWPSYTS